MKRWSAEDAQGSKTALHGYAIYVMIHVSTPRECTTSQMNPHVNRELWLMGMCRCGLTGCSKSPASVQGVRSGQAAKV